MRNPRTAALTFAVTLIAAATIGCAHTNPLVPGPAFGTFSSAGAAQRAAAPQTSKYAYIADDFNPGHVYVYALPLTASSRPIQQIDNLVNPGSIGFDPGRVFVLVANSPSGEGILVIEPWKKGPISFLLPVSSLPEMLEVDKSGDVFEGQTYVHGSYGVYQINVFKHPITHHSAPAFTMNAAGNHSAGSATRGMNFDRHGNLWVKDDDNATMDEFVPPFSPKSKPALTFPKGSGAPYGSVVFDAHDAMFVTNGGGIDVYYAPFTKKTAKAFTIGVPNAANIMAVDASGDLYVTSSTGVVSVFAPPFSASSLPVTTLALPGSPGFAGIAIK